jgi:heptosyltransferase-2
MTAASQTAPVIPTEPSAILVRTPNWLGDLLMSTAFLRALLSRFPDVRVDLIVRRGFEVLPLPHRGEIFPYDKAVQGPGAFGKGLRGRGHSHFFVLPPSLSSAWMALRSGVPHRIGYGGGGRGLLLRPALHYGHSHRSVHLVTEYLGLLRPFGMVPDSKHLPGLEVSEGWIAEHIPSVLAAAHQYVVLAPGAEFGPAKQWPLAHYAALAAGLREAGKRVVVAGLAKDRDAAAEILAGDGDGLNLCGETDLPALVALLARAGLLVSNDSGAMHLAAALQVPQVALFGSSNPSWTAPLNPKAEVVYRGLDCSPCYKRTCPLGHTDCLREISPTEVLEHALILLGE